MRGAMTIASSSAPARNAAAVAVLDWHGGAEVCESLWRIGKEMRDAVSRALRASGLAGVHIEGLDPMWFLRFDAHEIEGRFLRSAVEHGALFKRDYGGMYGELFPELRLIDQGLLGPAEGWDDVTWWLFEKS